MKGLLKKDLRLMKGQKQFFLVAFVFAVLFLFVNKMVTFGVSYLMIMFLMFTLSTITYDEYDNGYAFLFTLPINRKLYVKEKYVFCVLISTVVCVVSSIVVVVFTMMRENPDSAMDVLLSCLAAFVTGMVLMAIMIPIQLKFGSEKRQIAMIIGFVGIFFIIFLGNWLLDHFQLPHQLLEMVVNVPLMVWASIGIVLILLGIILSYFISVRIMEKKEF